MSVADQLRVLIVDDTSTSRLLLRDALDQIGVNKVFFATDGEKALKFMMDTPAHLVISDVNMPVMDGMGLLKAIRGYKPTQRVPFIVLTGQADKAIVETAAKLGVNNYLVKPVTVPKLKTAIEAIFGKL
ncbi:response regulator [Methylocystis echinoides]|jgi:two-component system chemotaxis response regulator CheY|uniref:response regulator n=1 Tax=Methylocystis echinoides TaxID=29468 RepID=UPI00343D2A3B